MARNDDAVRWLGWGLHALGAAIACGLLTLGWAHARWIRTESLHMRALRGEAAACIAREENARRELHEARRRLESATTIASQFDARLSDGPQEARLIARLAQVGKAADVELDSFHPQCKPQRDFIGLLEIRLSCTGEYEGICAFLTGIQQLPRLCRVADLDLSLIDDSGSRLRAEILVVAPFKNLIPQSAKSADMNYVAQQQ